MDIHKPSGRVNELTAKIIHKIHSQHTLGNESTILETGQHIFVDLEI